jgi:hypothetical protein
MRVDVAINSLQKQCTYFLSYASTIIFYHEINISEKLLILTAAARNFSQLHSVETGSGVHPTSY